MDLENEELNLQMQKLRESNHKLEEEVIPIFWVLLEFPKKTRWFLPVGLYCDQLLTEMFASVYHVSFFTIFHERKVRKMQQSEPIDFNEVERLRERVRQCDDADRTNHRNSQQIAGQVAAPGLDHAGGDERVSILRGEEIVPFQ